MEQTLLEEIRKLTYKNGALLTSDGVDKATNTTRGYRQLYVLGKGYLVHRLVWLYFHGHMPKVVDHINGDKADNRIENLQNCTQKENIAKANLFNTNKTGYKGVSYCKNADKYEAYVYQNYAKIHLGLFATAEEANNAKIEYLGKKYGLPQ